MYYDFLSLMGGSSSKSSTVEHAVEQQENAGARSSPTMSNIFASAKPVLTYFDLYGRGEAIRMALTHSKTDFEDNRVSGESWAAFKASGKCNNGQVPVLEVGGQALNQSEAILRFVGAQVGSYNTAEPFAMWAADAVINTCSDFEKSAPKNGEGRPRWCRDLIL